MKHTIEDTFSSKSSVSLLDKCQVDFKGEDYKEENYVLCFCPFHFFGASSHASIDSHRNRTSTWIKVNFERYTSVVLQILTWQGFGLRVSDVKL